MINLWSPICDTGYGIASLNILKKLDKITNVALYPISKPTLNSIDDLDIVKKCLNKRDALNNWTSLKIWHQNDLFSRIGSGKHIGYPIFELTSFDEEECLSLKHCDKIFVCSKWAKEIILNTIPNADVAVVPLGVDCTTFKPSNHINRNTTVFFNCGKWSMNKGHDVLLDCFNNAFSPDDDVELWMMCDNMFIGEKNKEWEYKYKNSRLGDKIRFIPRQFYHKDVARIMNMTDCGIFPARGEGWNLELLEMMACGKHVIATNYSGHTEFCNNHNSYLIDIDNLETAFDGIFFDGKKGLWAEISSNQIDQTVEHMRRVYKDKLDGKSGLNIVGIETSKKYSWENTASSIVENL